MTLIEFKPNHIKICLEDGANRDAPAQIAKKISEWLQEQWIVEVVSNNNKTENNITLAEEDRIAKQKRHIEAIEHPVIEQVLESFPGAKIVAVEDIK